MPRKRMRVEIGVTAGILLWLVGLLGCATPQQDVAAANVPEAPVPKKGSGTSPPDGLDYIRAVQCGGLLWALQGVAFTYDSHKPGLLSMVGLYREWAELRASQDGKLTALALRDMSASRDDFLSGAGAGSDKQIEAAIKQAYPGDVKACEAAAAAADFDVVYIGG